MARIGIWKARLTDGNLSFELTSKTLHICPATDEGLVAQFGSNCVDLNRLGLLFFFSSFLSSSSFFFSFSSSTFSSFFFSSSSSAVDLGFQYDLPPLPTSLPACFYFIPTTFRSSSTSYLLLLVPSTLCCILSLHPLHWHSFKITRSDWQGYTKFYICLL